MTCIEQIKDLTVLRRIYSLMTMNTTKNCTGYKHEVFAELNVAQHFTLYERNTVFRDDLR